MYDHEELREYVVKTCEVFIQSVPDGFEIIEPIKFDLAVVHKKGVDGKINVKIATFGKDSNAEIVQRFQVQYNPIKKKTTPVIIFGKG